MKHVTWLALDTNAAVATFYRNGSPAVTFDGDYSICYNQITTSSRHQVGLVANAMMRFSKSETTTPAPMAQLPASTFRGL